MSVKAIAWAFDLEIDDPSAKFVLVAICDHVDEDGWCWPSLSRLARKTGFDRSTVQRSMQKLVDRGLLRRVPRLRDNGSRKSDLLLVVPLSTGEDFIGADGGERGRSVATPRGTEQHPPGGAAPIGAERLGGGGTEPPLEPSIEPSELFTADQPLSDWPKDYQEKFWSRYPVKRGKGAALRKLEALRKSGRVTWAALMDGLDRMDAAIKAGWLDPQFVKHPSTWLNGDCWDDVYSARAPRGGGGGGANRRSTFDDVIDEARGEFYGSK